MKTWTLAFCTLQMLCLSVDAGGKALGGWESGSYSIQHYITFSRRWARSTARINQHSSICFSRITHIYISRASESEGPDAVPLVRYLSGKWVSKCDPVLPWLCL